MKTYLEIGKITSPHGVKGEVKVEVWSDSPEALTGVKQVSFYADGREPIAVCSARPQQMRLLLRLDGVNTADEANTLRGKVLWAHRDSIKKPAGSYFIDDLIGLAVLDADTGHTYGTLSEVTGLAGRNDVYTVRGEDGRETLIPAIPQVIVQTDPEGGRMLIRPLEGLFDEN